jgi:hypothetical protein
MKHARKTALAASAFTCAALLSFGWSEQGGISLSIESAQARVGRPLTPVSVAGVARRQTRRAVYGAGAVGAGAAAVGTAAAIGTAGAVAATSPNWGWGGPYQTGTGYYAGGPYYGGSVRGARAAYYGGYQSPAPAWGGVSNSDREMYIKNLHDSGYNLKNNFNAAGNIQG